MLFIAHRVNTVEELRKVPVELGVEIDLRDADSNRLILQHDPFKDGEDFDEWCKEYKHAMLILNIKSEAIEWRVLEVCKKYNIQNFFFLDSSVPMIMKLLKAGETRIAIRYSEVEPVMTDLAERCDWLWVDCFTKYPDLSLLKKYRCCMVGPALQGHTNWVIQEEWKQASAACDKIYNFEKWAL